MTDFLANIVRRGSGSPLPTLQPTQPRVWPWDGEPLGETGEDGGVSPLAIAPPASPVRRQPVPITSPPPAHIAASIIPAVDTRERGPALSSLTTSRPGEPVAGDTAADSHDHRRSNDPPPARAQHAPELPSSSLEPMSLEARRPTESRRSLVAQEDLPQPVEVNIGTIEIQLLAPALTAAPAAPRPKRPAPVGFDGYRAFRTYRRRG